MNRENVYGPLLLRPDGVACGWWSGHASLVRCFSTASALGELLRPVTDRG